MVIRHKVVFDVRPALSVYTGERVTIGFDVELRGTHERGAKDISPGCSQCEAVWEDLKRLAEAVLPHDVRPSDYYLTAFDHSIHETGRLDVQLTIEIRHREGYNRPLDESEERSVHDISTSLRRLGVQEHDWSEFRVMPASLAPPDR